MWDCTALAAQLWCREDTKNIEFDGELAEEFVERIKRFENTLAHVLIFKSMEENDSVSRLQ